MPWVNHPKPLSRLKAALVPKGEARRRVVTGAFRGLSFEMDLRRQLQLFLGLHERELYRYLRTLSRGIRSAVDVGAADGEYALYFLLRAKAEFVIAVEPVADLRAAVHRNVKFNSRGKGTLEVCPYFVAEADGADRRTLDSLASGLDTPCLIKVDVDGGELDVLRGSTVMLGRAGVRWLIETHSQDLERECLRILGQAGHQCRVVPNAWWRIIVPEMRPIPHNRWLVAWKP